MTIEQLEPPLAGGCLCGRVRYQIQEGPIAYYACHCTDCQRQSGLPFGPAMVKIWQEHRRATREKR